MSGGSEHKDSQNRSVQELLPSSQSVFISWYRMEQLKTENDTMKNEKERLKSEKMQLEDELMRRYILEGEKMEFRLERDPSKGEKMRNNALMRSAIAALLSVEIIPWMAGFSSERSTVESGPSDCLSTVAGSTCTSGRRRRCKFYRVTELANKMLAIDAVIDSPGKTGGELDCIMTWFGDPSAAARRDFGLCPDGAVVLDGEDDLQRLANAGCFPLFSSLFPLENFSGIFRFSSNLHLIHRFISSRPI